MIAYKTHVVDESISSPSAKNCLVIVFKSIYLALSHIMCETAALRTAAQSITSTNLCKILAKGILFVSLHINNSPSAI